MKRYKIRMMQDLNVVGVLYEKGLEIKLGDLDRVHEERGEVELCIGHGEHWVFRIGKDVILIINEERRVGPKDRREK